MGLKCHSSFVHYNMYHKNHCHGGGDIIGSVFNYTNNCGGGCGSGFMGGLGFGFGLGVMNLLSGWFNGGGFGGFNYGMPGMSGMLGMLGLGGGGGASDRDYSEYSSSRSRRSTCDCKCGEKQEVDYTDADSKKRADLLAEINDLKAPIDDATYNLLKGKIELAKKASESDPKNLEADLKAYAELLENLDKIKALSVVKTEVPVVEPTVVAPITDPDLDIVVNKNNYIQGYSDCDENDLTNLSTKGVKRAHDVVGYAETPQVRDIKADAPNKPYEISADGKTIKLFDQALGSTGVEYDYIGKTATGQIVFKDKTANQLYLLQKTGSGDSIEYHLIQYAGMRGSGEAAHSSNN